MIHPSYVELMDVINEGVASGEQPVVNSRYSVVCATAKRARQLIAGADPLDENDNEKNPLSAAVKELYEGKLRILTPDEIIEKERELVDIEMAIARLEESSEKANREEKEVSEED